MPGPRKLCFHKATKRYYVTDPRSRKEVCFGKDRTEAENRYRQRRIADDLVEMARTNQLSEVIFAPGDIQPHWVRVLLACSPKVDPVSMRVSNALDAYPLTEACS